MHWVSQVKIRISMAIAEPSFTQNHEKQSIFPYLPKYTGNHYAYTENELCIRRIER